MERARSRPLLQIASRSALFQRWRLAADETELTTHAN
jgi:hypothetical protein